MVRLGVIVFLAFAVGGCANTYKEAYESESLLNLRSGALSRDAAFAVAVLGDGSYGTKVKDGSGGKARDAMRDALSQYADRVAPIAAYLSEADATAEAHRQGSDYLVYLRILNWEERATEWSGKPDRLEAEIRLVDAKTMKVLESKIVKGNSKWATFGGDHVEDLLVKPFNEYAAALFGA